MKKFLLLLLSLTLVFSCLVSCGLKKNDNDNKIDAEKGTVEYVAAIVAQSLPTKIVTQTKYVSDDDVFEGFYETEIDRANKKTEFSFEYQRIAIPGEDISDGYKKTEKGLVQFREGEVLRSEGSDWETLGEGYLNLSLSVVQSMLKTYTVSEDSFDLTSTVAVENTQRVFGSAINAEGDVTLDIDTNGKYLYSVKISYVSADTGALVEVNTSYEYAPVTFDF